MKRIIDQGGAALLLILLAPFFASVAALIFLTMGSPVLFRQIRPGLYGRPFRIVKFRTMAIRRRASGELLPDAMRLNSLGRIFRSTSLDELPELWNVLKGDMSLVGPRPLLMQYLGLYTAGQARRHNVLPGITGWAQVHGRNALTWEEKFALDLWYVDHRNFSLDLKILWLTLLNVLQRKGIQHGEHATMPEFLGSSKNDLTRSTQGGAGAES